MLYYDIIIDYKKFRGKAGDVHPVLYHGKAVCEQQGMTSNKEFKEVKEIKEKTNDCTLSRADAEYGQSYARAETYACLQCSQGQSP